jgi:hypothetical protein
VQAAGKLIGGWELLAVGHSRPTNSDFPHAACTQCIMHQLNQCRQLERMKQSSHATATNKLLYIC